MTTSPKMKYANASTLAGRYRQVGEGRAMLSGPGGLTKDMLTQNRQGRWVSKAKSKASKASYRRNPIMQMHQYRTD